MIGFGLVFSGFFGYLLGHAFGAPIIGLIIGGWLGHKFDRAVARILHPFSDFIYSNYQRSSAQQVFFEVTFAVMGCLAKADGIISKEEIKIAESAMIKCRMNSEQKAEAKAAFNRGKSKNYNLAADITRFRQNVGANILLIQLFLDFQMQTARTDFSPAKERKLEEICRLLGINQQQNHFHHTQTNNTDEAYHILGLKPGASNTEIKKAYRKLMAEHHPDKLIAKGLPQEMIDIATEKTSKIQQAYRKLAKLKGIK